MTANSITSFGPKPIQAPLRIRPAAIVFDLRIRENKAPLIHFCRQING
jgi:hypothetical protein